ncbi:MAG: glycosyltransferase family 25 protein [Verrucomicrobiota bacterium]
MIPYTIIHIDSRAKKHIKRTKEKLRGFNYTNRIPFFDGRKSDGRKVLEKKEIFLNWKPYDGRTTDPLPSEFGVWVSNVRVYEYIVKKQLDRFLILEDDVIVCDAFLTLFPLILEEIPADFDFVSLYSFDFDNEPSEETEMSLNYLQRSFNQHAAFQGMIFSHSGARRVLEILKTDGIEYTNDCMVYEKAREGKLTGYSLRKDVKILSHDMSIASTIDTTGIRMEGVH